MAEAIMEFSQLKLSTDHYLALEYAQHGLRCLPDQQGTNWALRLMETFEKIEQKHARLTLTSFLVSPDTGTIPWMARGSAGTICSW